MGKYDYRKYSVTGRIVIPKLEIQDLTPRVHQPNISIIDLDFSEVERRVLTHMHDEISYVHGDPRTRVTHAEKKRDK